MRPATKRLKVDNVPMSDNGTVLQPFHPEDMEIIKASLNSCNSTIHC